MGSNAYKDLASVNDIDGFIVTNPDGKIIEQQIQNPEKLAAMVARCGNTLKTIGKSNFSHAVIQRNNSRDILIFPVGNHYIGMVKKENTKTIRLIHTIKNMITAFTVES